MRIALFLLCAACADNTVANNADLSPKMYPKQGDPCGTDAAVDPNACGPDYVCMVVGSQPPVCLVLSGPGEGCGGFTAQPRQCKPGLTCKLGPIPDTGGTCQ